MQKLSPCPNCQAMVNDTQIYCGFCGIKLEDEPLTQDYEVSFESIHANVGHFGKSVEYVRHTHTVLIKRWGTGTEMKSESLVVPQSIQTKRELNAFLDGKTI